MKNVKVRLKDGSVREYPAGTTVIQVAEDLGSRLAAQAVAGRFNGELRDLNYPLNADGELEIITLESEEGLEIYRHTTSHILAQAVQRLYPNTRLGIGPPIESGFYYDFDCPETFRPEDLPEIE
ncbi:MAG: TGS domain-containing protein, partial [Syntrophomonadaceae bacterium]|nr:TGS domain-containing protein [Syntrophomonadaceae bacterium]